MPVCFLQTQTLPAPGAPGARALQPFPVHVFRIFCLQKKKKKTHRRELSWQAGKLLCVRRRFDPPLVQCFQNPKKTLLGGHRSFAGITFCSRRQFFRVLVFLANIAHRPHASRLHGPARAQVPPHALHIRQMYTPSRCISRRAPRSAVLDALCAPCQSTFFTRK